MSQTLTIQQTRIKQEILQTILTALTRQAMLTTQATLIIQIILQTKQAILQTRDNNYNPIRIS